MQITRKAPIEQREQIWLICVLFGRPLMQAVILHTLHLYTIQVAAGVGLSIQWIWLRLDREVIDRRMADSGDIDSDIHDPQQDWSIPQEVHTNLEIARIFKRTAGQTSETGFPDISLDDKPGFEDFGEVWKFYMVTILDRARRDYRHLRAVQIALNSLAASLGASTLVLEAMMPSSVEEMEDNLADLREPLESMLTEDQIDELEPTDAEVREILRITLRSEYE